MSATGATGTLPTSAKFAKDMIVQLRQPENIVEGTTAMPPRPAGPTDFWIYAAVQAVDAEGVTVRVNHPGNRAHGETREIAAADLAKELRTKNDVVAAAAAETDARLNMHWKTQIDRLSPEPEA